VLDSPLPIASAGSKGDSSSRSPRLEVRRTAAEFNMLPTPDAKPGAGSGIELIRFPAAGETGGTAEAGGSAARRNDEKNELELIPAGSFVRVVMLNGVDAPTGGQAQSNPLPIAFHVEDTANLANKHRLDIRDCRIIAVAWGDVSSERTMGRTETLNCIINGEAVEMSIKGSVMGEDGKVGIRGRLVTKQGQILANALFAGSLGGIGRAFQSAASTITSGGGGVSESVDPSRVAQAGIGGGVGQASTMLAQYYLKAADKLYPVIETDGGRVVEILITKSAVYTGKRTGAEQYRSLLHRAGAALRSDYDD
jgi:conjugal transfer pilus assembly protein TraB